MAGKGKPGPPKGVRHGGRKKGTPNRMTTAIKEAVEQAFDRVGGVDYLVEMAYAEPKAFLTLLGRVLPTKIEADITVTAVEIEQAIREGRKRVMAHGDNVVAINDKVEVIQ